MEKILGREFSDELLARIQTFIASEPRLSRRRLSLHVCEWLDWRNASGRLQEMSCRKALLELDRRSAIKLPAARKSFFKPATARQYAPPPISPVEGDLSDLGIIDLVRVERGPDSLAWRGMLDAYHYLKSGPLCGAQARYLVRSEFYGWVGAFSFSACALRVECRENWIGWNEECRRDRLNLVVNNSRFLIPPAVKVKDLASHVLALAEQRLPSDWEALYGYRPVLLETYVERDRFAGSSYAGAGWFFAGSTRGRGRKGTGASIKDVYLKPLSEDWRRELCQVEGIPQPIRQTPTQEAPRDWIEEEFGRADLGDRRLTARLLKMTGHFYESPLANIPQACEGVHAAKAVYRFLDNEHVGWEAILRSHYLATEDRMREHEVVLVAQDTTTINLSTHPKTEGLGPIGNDLESVRGLMVHDTMCFTPEGTPLGLLDVQIWARDALMGSAKERAAERALKGIEEKESRKWLESYRAVSAVQSRCRRTKMVMVADREADLHELFVEYQKTPHGAELLVRAERSRNRKVRDEADNHDYLWTILEQQPVIETRELLLPLTEDRRARNAMLEVRAAAVTLLAPKSKPGLPDVKLWAIFAMEPAPPEGEDPVEWMLLSTVPTGQNQEANQRVEWYAKRWGIEVFHRIIKSGCRVERRQLETARRMSNCLAVDMVVAWRIHYLTMQGRQVPEMTCAIYFTPDEWKALCTFVPKVKKPPTTPPTLNQAVGLLGQLGGHLGRKGDGEPGSEVIWRGLSRLADISEAYKLYS